MPVVVQLSDATFTDPRTQAALAAMSAADELVLLGARRVVPEDGVSQLRQMLAPRRMVVLLVDDHVPRTERALIEDLLNDGIIPVVLTRCDPTPPDLISWLNPAEPSVRQVFHRAAHRPRTLVRRPVVATPGHRSWRSLHGRSCSE